jgi:hypothetical protein
LPRITWNSMGQRFFETGVDRGVLYVDSNPGVAWVGLTSVSESPSGGDPRPYYIDGVKYLNLATAEEFEATINAFQSPLEFGPCDGTLSIQNGLFVTQQPRKSFGLSYRTRLGNDVDGADHAYKIHLVYNALAAPSQRSNNSLGGEVNPTTFSWAITTRPPAITGYKRTAHLVIDSRLTDPAVLTEIEDLIYGSEANQPQLPTPDELIAIFS